MVVSLINLRVTATEKQLSELTAELGSPFLFPALFLSLSKQKLVSYQLEWTDRVDPMLEAHRGCSTPIQTTTLSV